MKTWELAIERGGVAMRYRRDGRNCTDRWRLRGGALELVATICPP